MTTEKEQLDLVSRCLNDPDDPKNRADLAAFRAASAANERFFIETHRIWILSAKAQRLDLIDTAQSASKLRKRLTPEGLHIGFRRIAGIAASLALVAGLLWYYIRPAEPRFITYTSQSSGPDSLFLSDGSLVVLASGTAVRYPEVFSETERKIDLLKGMALFVVSKDKTKPFRIAVDSAEVRVLGTSFNIAKTAKTIQVSVRSGQVLFTAPGATKSFRLNAGQALTWNVQWMNAKFMQTKNADAWVTRKLLFVDAPLEEVCRQLSDYYQVEIIARNRNPHIARKLNARFDGESLEGVLELIRQTYPVQITKESNQAIIISY